MLVLGINGTLVTDYISLPTRVLTLMTDTNFTHMLASDLSGTERLFQQ
jgi:hypothetical protein